jgi:protein gp37
MKRDYSHFNGEILTHSERLSIPLKRRKPTVYAVWNDLFHEDVPFGFIHEVFGTMRQTPQHVYLVLTKRPEWMQEAVTLVKNLEILGWANGFYSHVFYGLTVCNQQEADEKIPVFLQVQGKKFLSIEPMLGAMKLFYGHSTHVNNLKNISALILGGETGPGARPMHPDWVRSVRDQCAAAGVPFYFKQGLKGKTNWTTSDVAQWGNGEVINKMLDGITLKTPFYRYIDGCTHDELPWVTP